MRYAIDWWEFGDRKGEGIGKEGIRIYIIIAIEMDKALGNLRKNLKDYIWLHLLILKMQGILFECKNMNRKRPWLFRNAKVWVVFIAYLPLGRGYLKKITCFSPKQIKLNKMPAVKEIFAQKKVKIVFFSFSIIVYLLSIFNFLDYYTPTSKWQTLKFFDDFLIFYNNIWVFSLFKIAGHTAWRLSPARILSVVELYIFKISSSCTHVTYLLS